MNIKELAERLAKYPDLRKRVEEALAIVDDPMEEIMLSDHAEELVVEAVRGMGHDLMKNWAEQCSHRCAQRLEKQVSSAKKNIKKKSTGKPPLEK
jgi:hypothetical protein